MDLNGKWQCYEKTYPCSMFKLKDCLWKNTSLNVEQSVVRHNEFTRGSMFVVVERLAIVVPCALKSTSSFRSCIIKTFDHKVCQHPHVCLLGLITHSSMRGPVLNANTYVRKFNLVCHVFYAIEILFVDMLLFYRYFKDYISNRNQIKFLGFSIFLYFGMSKNYSL